MSRALLLGCPPTMDERTKYRDDPPIEHDEEPEIEAPACASCLAPLAEGDAFDVRADEVCPACAAEWAMEILTAEAHPDWTPTRPLAERFRALEIVKLLLPRWEKRIRADEAKRLSGGRA